MGRKLQFFVAGLGRFGESVAVTLEKMGYDVMAMDIAEDVVQDLSDTLGYVVCADCSDEKNLTAIGAGNADVAVVAPRARRAPGNGEGRKGARRTCHPAAHRDRGVRSRAGELHLL